MKLPKPVHSCGHILYKHYLIIFGGSAAAQKYQDSIFILDLRSDGGWKKLEHIKCPIAGNYLATIRGNGDVHLFTLINKWPNWKDTECGHYSLPISELLGPDFNVDQEFEETKWQNVMNYGSN